MPDQEPLELQYSRLRTPIRSNETEFIFRPRYRLAAALVVLAVIGFITAVANIGDRQATFMGISRHTLFVWVHIAAVVLLCVGHLLSRWPADAGVEPLTVALVRWFAQIALRFLVLLSLAYLVDGPVAAIFACFGIMLLHDFIVILERRRRGEVL